MSRKIKELERECNEKERNIKDLRDKIRQGRENERRCRDMKDNIRDKDRLVRSLRNELLEAERALDEYKDAYERLCDELDNKRRRRN